MDKTDRTCQASSIQQPSSPCDLLAKGPLTDALESQVLQAQVISGSCVVCGCVHFSQQTGLHIENEAAHRNLFSNPGMRSDFFDLLPGIFLGVLEGEESHGSRRSVSR